MLALSSIREALAAIAAARDVSLTAYMLRSGPIEQALEAAARRGAHVSVRLESQPVGHGGDALARLNGRIVARLRAAGADAQLGHPLHAKELVTDGALFLDGKNWNGGDFVVRDDDRAGLATAKHEALAAEAALLARADAGDRAIVESESFGSGNPVYSALAALARNGGAPRVLVSARDLAHNGRERALLQHLRCEGAEVRVCDDSDKLAAVGQRAWLGSANATYDGFTDQMTDWGACTAQPNVASAVRDRLEERWRSARPLTVGEAGR